MYGNTSMMTITSINREIKFFISTFVLAIFLIGCGSNVIRKEFPLSEGFVDSKLELNMGTVDNININSRLNKTNVDPVTEPGFLFEISNLEDQVVNGKFRVDFDSKLKLPYNVMISTENLKVSEVQRKILHSYRRFFQTSSAMKVQLVKKEYLVEVRGLVEKPAQLNMKLNESIESLIARSGGLKTSVQQKELEPRYLKLIKKDKSIFSVSLVDYFKSGALPKGFVIDGGDQLVFQVDAPQTINHPSSASGIVQVMGEVVRPGDMTYLPGADIYYYLQLAGGPTMGADLSEVKIVRGKSYQRVMSDVDALKEEPQPVLMAGDLIIVPFEKTTKLERNVSVLSGITSILSALVLIILVL